MSHAFHIGSEFAKEFIEAMGIDHSRVRHIRIDMGVNELTTVEVDYIMELQDMEKVKDLKKKYIMRVEEIAE